MGDMMNAVRAVVAVVLGAGIGYFWSMNPPLGMNDLPTVIGVSLVSIIVLFFLLKSISKGS
ncbi:MAG TPA: hypothetical protein PKJ97_00285 [Candidatus Bilamarchaeaceae archaeon]|nr:hypothetical protein [Candidatus Bilamarchaeaceae archaeon]